MTDITNELLAHPLPQSEQHNTHKIIFQDIDDLNRMSGMHERTQKNRLSRLQIV